MASVKIDLSAPVPYISPAEIYSLPTPPLHAISTPPIRLRIATGGAGQSGLVRALAEAFILYSIQENRSEPFSVAWLLSDTSGSFNYLASRAADCSITYHKVAEEIAVQQGVADRREYAWRDHWLLVGPTSNPASLPTDPSVSIYTHFTHLFRAAISTSSSSHPVKFLSRYDKSAANIKESSIWAAIGQIPWSEPFSPWYHRFVDFPFQALKAAGKLDEYTITDKGSWISVGEEGRGNLMVFKASTDEEDDPLLNPAHLLVGARGENRDMANKFADWMAMEDGGQKVVANFAVNGEILYTVAPRKKIVEAPQQYWFSHHGPVIRRDLL